MRGKSIFYNRRTGHARGTKIKKSSRSRPPASVIWISYRIHKKDITGSSKKSSSKWERVIPDSKTIFLSVDLPPTSIKSFGAPTNRNAERTQMHTKGPKVSLLSLEPEAGSPVVKSGHRGCNVRIRRINVVQGAKSWNTCIFLEGCN
jgi:hypothetical protein